MSEKILLSEYAKTKRNSELLSTREFAKIHGSSSSQINKYESGYYDNRITPRIAKSICKIYDLSYEEFLSIFSYQQNLNINMLSNSKTDNKSLNVKDLEKDIKIIDECFKSNNISNNSLDEAIIDLKRLLSIIRTLVCENYEPKDLETAKYKLKLMIDERNRYMGAYENLLVKYENTIKEEVVFTYKEIYKIKFIIETYLKISKYDLTLEAQNQLKEIINKLNKQYFKLMGISTKKNLL